MKLHKLSINNSEIIHRLSHYTTSILLLVSTQNRRNCFVHTLFSLYYILPHTNKDTPSEDTKDVIIYFLNVILL